MKAQPLFTDKHRCTSAKAHARKNQTGFSLLEVLISIVILSFGLLGMVGLQAAALQANRDARLQSVASSFAREIAELMRSNKNIALAAGNPYIGSFQNPTGTTSLAPATPANCLNIANAPCTTATLANAHMTDWLARVDNALPGARVVICLDATPYAANGVPQWACTAGANATHIVKIGWTRTSTDKTKTGADALIRADIPSTVLSFSPGDTL